MMLIHGIPHTKTPTDRALPMLLRAQMTIREGILLHTLLLKKGRNVDTHVYDLFSSLLLTANPVKRKTTRYRVAFLFCETNVCT